MSEAKSADELYKFVSDYFMNNNKHNLTREEFYHWLAQYETKDLQRLSELEIKLNTVEQEVTEVKNHAFDEDQYHRKFDSFFYRTILPKVGEIIDREKGRTLEALDRVKGSVADLDQNTVKKSNLTKYISAAVGIIFTGGIGSTWTAVYDMQQKLDQVPVLVQNVEELQEERRNIEKQLFVIEGAATTLKDRFVTLEENELKLRSSVQQLESSVQTNAYSITDVLERLSTLGSSSETFN